MPKADLLYNKDGVYRSPMPPISLPKDPNFSLIPFLFKNVSSINSHLPALIDAETSQTFTFSDLRTQVLSFSHALLTLNVSKNDIVLILSPNSILFPVAFFAVVAIGAVATTANPLYTTGELSKQVEDSNPKLVVTVPDLYDKIVHLGLPCVMLSAPGACGPVNLAGSELYYYWDLIKSSSNILSSGFALPSVAQTDVAAVIYTSGTGGTSKGAVVTHRNLIASALMTTSDGEGSKDVVLCFLPMCHMYALSAIVFQRLQRGDAVVAMARYEMSKMLRAVEKYRVTHLYMVPPVAVELVKKHELVRKYDVSSLREVITGAAPLGKDVMVEFSRIFPHAVVTQAYGMTETGGMISMGNIDASSSHFGSTGMLVSGMEAQIMSLETMTPLPPCQKGEIWVRGPSVMQGYLNNRKATMETIDDKGWLHTGDFGYFNHEGKLYVVNRIKELIKYKGFQVAPVDLEELLLTHPQVMDAAVIGIPDDEAGEVPIAYVVQTQLGSVTVEEMKEFVAKQVAPFKRLRSVIFTEAIPKSTSGKILKMELSRIYLSKL